MITEDALARLLVAWEACELSEAARKAVPSRGEQIFTDADAVLVAAERFSRAVAELARQAGVDWHPPRTDAGDEDTWWRHHVRNEPVEAAEDLDDWVLRHRDGEAADPAPVSRYLRSRISRSGP